MLSVNGELVEVEQIVPTPVEHCKNNIECNAICAKQGKHGGCCINKDYCKCYNKASIRTMSGVLCPYN
ncbi:hypothetical protein P8452_59390 [Trifolium repens]|nr:hypothetical protein P8452_59390 [Trifolium repens]